MTNEEIADALETLAECCNDDEQLAIRGVIYSLIGTIYNGATPGLLRHITPFNKYQLERLSRKKLMAKPIKSNESLSYSDCKQLGLETCHSQKDGNCNCESCPQLRDGEPERTGRHCPLDWNREEDYQ